MLFDWVFRLHLHRETFIYVQMFIWMILYLTTSQVLEMLELLGGLVSFLQPPNILGSNILLYQDYYIDMLL